MIGKGELSGVLAIARETSMRGSGSSLRDALRKAKYILLRPDLNEDQIEAALESDPAVIEEWLAYSQDKRTAGGWYFAEAPLHWVVGQITPKVSERFTSRRAACASFILRELDYWAGVQDDPPARPAARFVVDRIIQLESRRGVFLAGHVIEGEAQAGMNANIRIDGELYLTLPVKSIEFARLEKGNELPVLHLVPEDDDTHRWIEDLVVPGTTLVLTKLSSS